MRCKFSKQCFFSWSSKSGSFDLTRTVNLPLHQDTWKKRRIQEMIEEKRELRVDTLTDLFAPDNLGRHAAIINPDQQYASIFQVKH